MRTRSRAAVLALVVVLGTAFNEAHAADGLISVKSRHTAKETLDRFENAARAKGLNVFARIDHAAAAQKIGRTLRPTELLIFGSPQAGTPLLECGQSIGIDLPLKALAWQDASGQVWLSYNDLRYLEKRHGIRECGDAAQNISRNWRAWHAMQHSRREVNQ
jgi:uncharacterized protein (DUF302 family)